MESLTAVMTSTNTKGTMVVNQDREEISGINYVKRKAGELTQFHTISPQKLHSQKQIHAHKHSFSYLKYQQH